MVCFCLIKRFSVFLQYLLHFLLFPVCFYIFHLAKLLLALDTLIVIPVNLNFFLIYVRIIVLHYYGAYQIISLLNLSNPTISTFFHSSFALSFSSVQPWSTWYDNTMAFLSLQASFLRELIV